MNRKSISILVVSAEPAVADAIGRELRMAGFDAELRPARSLCEYRELLSDAPPDLVLIDLFLPDGLANDALVSPPEAGRFPVVVLVPPSDLETAVALIRAGAMDCLIQSHEALAALPICVSRVLRDWNLRHVRRFDNERLEQAQRFRRCNATLSAGIAHDMSNALASISMSLELIRETDGIMDGAALGTIKKGAQRAADIARQLVSLSNTAPESRLSFQPRHLVKETERLIRAAFPKSIQITNCCPKDLWLITANPIQFEEVVLNLTLCAHEAMPGGDCLALSAANVELDAASASRLEEAKPGRFVRLEVRHTGRSISSVAQRQTCNPTFSASSRPEKNGARQGFTTALGIVRGHGGFLALDRETGQGSVLQAYFPATLDTNACKSGGLATGQIHGAGQRVLVVDAEPLRHNTVTNLLRRHGFHVLSAADGVEALGLCARHLADLRLLLTDLDLPHMSGLALLRTVRQMNSGIAIMVMAGCCSEEQRTELAALNVTAVLAKPFAQEELLEALRQAFAVQTPVARCLSTATV